MLRIQSLAKITFEIDENFTPVLQSPFLRMNPKTSVTSLDKRDRQSLFPNNPLRIVHDPADHVSLSSLFNCQKTDGQYRLSLVRTAKTTRTKSGSILTSSVRKPWSEFVGRQKRRRSRSMAGL